MKNTVRVICIILFALLPAAFTLMAQPPRYIAFTGATVIDGSGAPAVPNGVVLISSDRIIAAGTREQVKIPENTEIINVSGKTIIPGLINTHGHVGDVKGIEPGNYSLKNIQDNLRIYGRYGITAVVSLGGDGPEAAALRDIGNSSGLAMTRLYIAGAVITGRTPEQAVAVVNSNDQLGVDIMKIRVDDNLGTTQKMPEEVYKAVMNRAHALGYQMAVHMYYLDDAKKLLRAGADMLAHSIRDRHVDGELIQLMREKNAFYCPTLTRELSTYIYESTPAFFSDPFFTKEYNRQTIAPLLDPSRQQEMRNSRSARIYKQQLPVAMTNLKTLSDSGIPIVMGTDTGFPLRFAGYFEHIEMEMMAKAGLSPMQILLSATGNAAKYMKLKDIGLLKAGYKADIVVLDKSPLDDIKNTRSISQVWIGGKIVSGKW